MENVLSIKNLKVSFDVYGGQVRAVRGVSFDVRRGEILALVGESGCGKTVTAQSVVRLNDSPHVSTTADRLQLGGFDVLNAAEKDLQQIRGGVAGMVFQDPMTCLNPTMKIGRQITERLSRRTKITASERQAEAVRLLEMVKIPDAPLRAQQYPHQFSGGMRQRIMIAMALAAGPSLLIADEPTTALDVTIQMQILKLIAMIRKEEGTSILLITHDFGVVANLADRIAVMYAGKIVEEGAVETIFHNSAHPYTRGLLRSLPLPDASRSLTNIPGSPPDLFVVQPGCAFSSRCDACMQICLKEGPPNARLSEGHTVSCWKYHESFPKGEDR